MLVVGDFVPGVVDAGEGEVAGLFGLAVDDGVRGRDVDVAGCGGAGDVDGVVDGFAAEPVAWVGMLDWDGGMKKGGGTDCCSRRRRRSL